MHGSATVGWLLTGVCALTGGACLLRALAGTGRRTWAAASEALMGFGMAAMAFPPAAGGEVPPTLYVLLFALVLGWELALLAPLPWPGSRGCGGTPRGQAAVHHVHHLLGAGAMVYLAVAMAGAHGGGGGGGAMTGQLHGAAVAGPPLLTGALLAYFAVYVVGTGARLLLAADGPAVRAGPVAPVAELPGLASACRLAMGTGTFAMLLTM